MQAFRANQATLDTLVTRNQNINRRAPAPMLESQKEWAEEHAVYIFNVGPWKQLIRRGPFCMDIPACKPGEKFSEPQKLGGIVDEQYPDSESTMKLLQYDGYQMALDLIGVGIGIPHDQRLTRYGLFVSKTNPPSAEDLAEANAALDRECTAGVNEMNLAFAEGPRAAANTFQAKYHNACAQRLGLNKVNCPWLGADLMKVADSMECPFCGTSMGAKLPKCPNCKEVVNQAAYKAAQALAREGLRESA